MSEARPTIDIDLDGSSSPTSTPPSAPPAAGPGRPAKKPRTTSTSTLPLFPPVPPSPLPSAMLRTGSSSSALGGTPLRLEELRAGPVPETEVPLLLERLAGCFMQTSATLSVQALLKMLMLARSYASVLHERYFMPLPFHEAADGFDVARADWLLAQLLGAMTYRASVNPVLCTMADVFLRHARALIAASTPRNLSSADQWKPAFLSSLGCFPFECIHTTTALSPDVTTWIQDDIISDNDSAAGGGDNNNTAVTRHPVLRRLPWKTEAHALSTYVGRPMVLQYAEPRQWRRSAAPPLAPAVAVAATFPVPTVRPMPPPLPLVAKLASMAGPPPPTLKPGDAPLKRKRAPSVPPAVPTAAEGGEVLLPQEPTAS